MGRPLKSDPVTVIAVIKQRNALFGAGDDGLSFSHELCRLDTTESKGIMFVH